MRKNIGWSLVLVILLILGGCGQRTKASDGEKIIIGSLGSDAEIWQYIAKSDAAKKAGLNIEVQDINDGVALNIATADKKIDVNAFQSYSYLVSFNKDSKSKLVPIATTYLEPMGIYSSKIKKIKEVPNHAVVALADNPANAARGLKLLAAAGLITLKSDFDSGIGSTSDIVSNPKNLEFKLIDDKTGPRVLKDVDLATIGNTIALEGGLNVLKDAIYYEKVATGTRENINILATASSNKNNKKLKKLAKLYHSSEVKAYLKKHFAGTKVDVNQPISYLSN